MKITLWKHILNEIWPTFAASMFIFVFLIVATRILSITEMIVVRGVSAKLVMMMMVYLLPDIITFALPATALMAVVISFLRLSADSEIIALKASGVSLYQMLQPVFVFSTIGLIIALLVGFFAAPWGNRSFKDLLFNIAQSNADAGIKERVFSQPFDGVVFYIKRFSSQERVMEDVFVVDRRETKITNTIIAEKAGLFVHPEQRILTLHFVNGTIFVSSEEQASDRIISFSTYDLHIDLKEFMKSMASRQRRPMEMTAGELLEELKHNTKNDKFRNEMVIKLMEKVTIPIAVFLMGVIGVPLGAHIRGRGRPAGIGLSLGVFLVYYLFLAGMNSICETGKVSPFLGVWAPNLFLLISCIYLIRQVARERSMNLFQLLSRRPG
ncbi:MAG: LPS export ABC transporter permease LptF [Deltaproteobacteria bacterium]|nr:LPS export ABC transporter permease LptF [Deltaproteobacteria bacterium]